MSILLKINNDPIDPGLLTISSSLAVVKALEKLFRINCQLKWVNDIIVDNRKVAGILVEGVTDLQSGSMDHVIIGLGMNYMTDPARFLMTSGIVPDLSENTLIVQMSAETSLSQSF